MAPANPPALPELDLAKCFAGEHQLISWEAAYTALCDPTSAAKSAPLKSFLHDATNRDALRRPWQPFAAPSEQEKARFEAKTAPISVTVAPDGSYNLDEIKADTLWLSQLASISQDASLRLVVQEWQSRPAAQLLSGLTEEEALSVNDAAGLSNLGASTFIPNSSIVTAPSGLPDTQFDHADQRKLRLLQTFTSTRIYILRISQLLVAWASAKDLRQTAMHDYLVCDEWLEELGQDITSSQGGKNALDQCIQAVETRWQTLNNGFTWDVPESIQDAAQQVWLTTEITEMIHILHIAVLYADSYDGHFVPAQTVERWFKFVAEQDFFRSFELDIPDQAHLAPLVQLFTSLLSLGILKVDLVLDHLDNEQYQSWDPTCYLLNSDILETITNIFLSSIALGPSPATPPAFAWAIITWALTKTASSLEAEREEQIQANAGSSIPAPTAFEDAVLSLARLESSDGVEKRMPFQVLAETCAEFGVLELVTQLTNLAMGSFGTSIDRISRDKFRLLHLHLIRCGMRSEIVQYCPELIICAHTMMTGDRTFRNWSDRGAPKHADLVTQFCLNDHVLRQVLIDEACTRYPYEITPLLQFFSALTRGEKATEDRLPSTAYDLANMSTLMQRLPQDFLGYSSVREEENSNCVQLSEDLPQFTSSVASQMRGTRKLLTAQAPTLVAADDYMTIPNSTEGNIVDDLQTPFVALWHYQHSGLEYLAKLLSTYVVGSNTVEFSTQLPATLQNATEIIGFFADLLHLSLRTDGGVASQEVLAALNVGAGPSQDVAGLVLAIFDQGLLSQSQEPGNVDSLELLVNCIRFLQALVRIAPNRVWPWLSRSRLLETDGNGGSLASILIGTEMVVGRYDFLIGCIHLFKALVEDAINHSVARKTPTKTIARFNAVSTSDSGISDKIMSSVLLTFGKTLASIYEGSLGWKYARVEDRLEINIGICDAFNDIMRLAYVVDDSKALSSKLTGLLSLIAEYLTELYLSKSQNERATSPLLTSLLAGAGIDKSSFETLPAALWRQQTKSALSFCNTLVDVAVLIHKPWTHLEEQLFKATPLLARLYATHDVYASPVVSLLDSLVRGALRVAEDSSSPQHQSPKSIGPTEPPSLLGHLGPRTAKNFLAILSRLEGPLKIVDVQTQVWHLLTAVVTCKQQWFSLYLLTGSTPRESVRSKTTVRSASKHKSLMSRALDTLANINLQSPDNDWRLYTKMLEFVASAQNNWSWATGDLKQHKEFIQKLLAFLKSLPLQPTDLSTSTGATTRSWLNTFTSLTCETLAMYIHSARQQGDYAPLKEVVPNLTYLLEHALRLPEYNSSLHYNLKQNFERVFNGISLSQLKRTSLCPGRFGPSFFYELHLAESVLSFSKDWSGPRGGGFSAEVVQANLNLGLVESQIELLKSWKLLAVELSNGVGKDASLDKVLLKVVNDCMARNAESNLPEALFGQLALLRADLAFVILQKLVKAKVNTPEARKLLASIWNAVRAATPDFDSAFSSDSVDYYRSLLRILYLALQFHLVDPSASEEDTTLRSTFRGSIASSHRTLVEPISNLLLEILSEIVAKGFRSLATQLHSSPDTVYPADFALLTAILQTILKIPEMTPWHAQAALLFANSNTLRYATSLFSWSERLTISNNGINDPIYGELSLLFILSLSAMQPLAESMAVEGILSQLNTANLMNYYRRPGGMSPFDSPARLFSIWTKGILPLCLNLLLAVGPAISGEISAFLNQYPAQLLRASNALNTRTASKITLSMASETHSLALIASIIESNRAQAPRLGIQASDIPVLDWDRENVKEDIESWMARKGALGERIVAVEEGDKALWDVKIPGEGSGNMLEERVVRELDGAGDCLGLGKRTA